MFLQLSNLRKLIFRIIQHIYGVLTIDFNHPATLKPSEVDFVLFFLIIHHNYDVLTIDFKRPMFPQHPNFRNLFCLQLDIIFKVFQQLILTVQSFCNSQQFGSHNYSVLTINFNPPMFRS